MRHVFVINPAAGKKQSALALIPKIHAYFTAQPSAGPYEVYVTKGRMDAKAFVEKDTASQTGAVRYYACGGDGTLMEVAGGIFGAKDAEVGFIPCGSANDFVRSVGPHDWFSIDAQVKGTAFSVDAIRCNGFISLNICSIGMDADVADKMIYFKHFPLVSGKMAYSLAVVYMFFKKIGRRLTAVIEAEDGTKTVSGDYLFSLAASGQYYGGNYHSAPQAVIDDGLLDFELIETIRRSAIPGFLKKYRNGKHLDMPIVHSYRGTRMTVTSDRPLTVVVDGECFQSDHVVFEVCPSALQFVRPLWDACQKALSTV